MYCHSAELGYQDTMSNGYGPYTFFKRLGVESGTWTKKAYLAIPPLDVSLLLKEYQEGKSYFINTKEQAKTLDFPLTTNFTQSELNYLASRSITPQAVSLFGIRSGGLLPDYKYRVWFPIYENNTIVSARGRSIVNAKPKYMALEPTLELIPHKHTLYGEWLNYGSKLGVLEGEIDVIRGGVGFVGTYGTQVHDVQIMKLSKYKEIMLMFDDDDAGRKAVYNVGNKIAMLSSTKVEVIFISSKYKDMGELPDSLIKELRQELFGK
jgi:hypothetical protein